MSRATSALATMLLAMGCGQGNGSLATSAAASGASAEAEPTPSVGGPIPSMTEAEASHDPPTTQEPGVPAATYTLGFDDAQVDAPPRGFAFGRTGHGRPGRWVIAADPSAPSPPNVLAQLDADSTDFRFAVALVDRPAPADVRVAVRCRFISGEVDQSCGLVARYRDENNYYVTRANVLENNIRLYYVRDGRRQQLASWRGTVTGGAAWHALQLDLEADHLQVFWDGELVLDHHDRTFAQGGLVGLWTKSDSVTHYDDLHVEAL